MQGLLVDKGQAALCGGLGLEFVEAAGLGLGVLSVFGAHPPGALDTWAALALAGGSSGRAAGFRFRHPVQFGRLRKVAIIGCCHLLVQQAPVVHTHGHAGAFQVGIDGGSNLRADFLHGAGLAVVQFARFGT